MSHQHNEELLENYYEQGLELAECGAVVSQEIEEFALSYAQFMLQENQ